MRNIPFKFRGIIVDEQKQVYGTNIAQSRDGRFFIGEDYTNENYEVYPDSVGQLIGYDEKGFEMYNGNPDWWNN